MNLRRLSAVPRFLGRLLSALVGELQWRPPAWLRGLGRSMRRSPRGWISSLLVLGILAFAGWQSYQWWEAHRTRAREMTAAREVIGKLDSLGLTTVKDGVRILPKLHLSFNTAAAALDQVGEGKDQVRGVTLSPEHPGSWKWLSDKSLVFTPTKDWPAGMDYKITLDPAVLPKEVRLKEPVWKFTTPALEGKVTSISFYTDPTDPSIHQVVMELGFSYPIAKEDLERRIAVEVLGGAPVFTWKGQTPKIPFTVVEGKNQQQFWIRTTRLQIPAKEDFLKISVLAGLPTVNGGKSMVKDVTGKERVPDAASGLRIAGMKTQIIRTDEGDPEQFLFINTEGYATPAEVQKNLEAWLLPANPNGWSAAGQVTAAILARAKPIKLASVESEAPFTQAHAFKFVSEELGILYVRVRKGMPGLGGFYLANEAANLVGVPAYPKELKLLGKGALLALNGERKIPVMTRGVEHVRYSLARVPAGQVNHLVTLTEGDFEAPQFRDSYTFDEENIARISREVKAVPMKNERQAAYSVFDFAPALQGVDGSDPDASRGLFFLKAEGVRPRTSEDDKADDEAHPDETKWISLDDEITTKRFVLVTDLGLLVKQNADGSRDVFVQSIQNGGPVNGARVLVLAKNGEFIAEAVTEDGHVHFADVGKFKREKQPVAILARLGNDLSFIPFERVDRALNFSRFDTAGVLASAKEALDAFLFTERGVYRPGDSVHVGAIVRRRDWLGTLSGLPVEMDVVDPRDHVVDTQKFALPQDGYFTWDCATDEADPTGVYQVILYLRKGSERERIGRSVFRVEDFQPDRMKLAVELSQPADAGWMTPTDVQANAHLETLFGFPAADRRIMAKMELSPAEFAFPQFPDFTFHNRLRKESQAMAGKTVELGEVKTDDEGRASFKLDLERFKDACFRMSLLVEAFEADGGRSVRGGASVLVSPFPYVVGYKGDGDLDYIGKDSARNVKLMAVDPALKPIAVEALSYRVIQIRYVSVLTKQDGESYAYVSTQKEQTTSEAPLNLAAAGTDFPLPTQLAGEFRLELRDAENRVICACPFTVVGKGDSQRSLERNAELELKLARENWVSGEQIEMSLNAPFTGSGLITVEREKVLGWQWFTSATASSVQHITVPAEMEGTGYVNVSFVRALDSPEVFMSPLSYAVQPFTANPDKRRMKVELDAPAVVKPGEVLHIGYRSEKPSRIVVYAVDEGIHQITRYALPQPLTHFLRKRALEVESEQLLDLIMPEYTLLSRSSAFGGDEDEVPKLHLNPFKRRKEPPVVFWSSLLQCGPERQVIDYTVPDYFAGSLKIMAVAVAPEQIGAGEAQCKVRGPFVLTPNVPTFAAPGDEFTVSLTVANNLEGAQANADVQLALTLSEHLEVIESPPNPLNVAPGKETTTRFRLRAKDTLGGAEMTFRAESGDQRMLRKATLSVRPAAPYMTEVQSGYFRLPTQDLKNTRQMYPQFAKREMTASVLPLGLARGLEAYVREYPHGCSEQISSRAMSRLLLTDEADFGFSRAEATQQLSDAFSLLGQRQHSNGSFGYWDSSSGGGFDFLSVYVTSLLVEAGDAGFSVPEDLMSAAKRYMKDIAKLKVRSLDDAWIQAAAIYLLTRQGEVTTPYLLNLRDTLEETMKATWHQDVTAAYVAATYALLQKANEGSALIKRYQKSVPRAESPRWYGYYYADPQVKKALGFALLCRHFPELAGDLKYEDLAVITDPIQRGNFNTITSACTILALKNYSTLAKSTGVQVAMSELLPNVPEPHSLTPASDGLRTAVFNANASTLRFSLVRPDNAPDLGAFYQVTAAGFDLKPPQEAVREGLEAIRDLLGADGKPVQQLKTGEGVTVRILVRNLGKEARSDVAVLDLMPGGFEIEAENLKPGKGTVPGAEFVEVREDRNVFFISLGAAETKTFTYRIKPVCAGDFSVPPVFAEAMYDRGIRGRSLATKIKVVPAE